MKLLNFNIIKLTICIIIGIGIGFYFEVSLTILLALFGIVSFIFSGCARVYHTIDPDLHRFENKKELMENVDIYYSYGAQKMAGNKPATRKENKRGVTLIAVQIHNNSDEPVRLSENLFSIHSGSGRMIAILNSLSYMDATQQSAPSFVIWYGLAGIGYTRESSTGPSGTATTNTFTWSPLPLAIGVINAIIAGVANKKQRDNLFVESIFDRTIAPKSVLSGLIPIGENRYSELHFSYGENEWE